MRNFKWALKFHKTFPVSACAMHKMEHEKFRGLKQYALAQAH